MMSKNIHVFTDSNEIIEALPFPLVIINHFGKIVYLNHQAELFLNISRKSAHCCELNDFLLENISFSTLFSQVKENRRVVRQYEMKLRLKNGNNKEFFLSLAPVENNDDLYIVTFHDHSLFNIIRNSRETTDFNQIEKNLALMLSHEIKNPLSGILGAAQLLQQTVTNEEKKLTDLICTEVERISKMLDRYIDETHKHIKYSKLNIHAILNHVMQIAKNGFAKDIRINALYDPSLPLIMGDKDALIQLFLNLIKNASEALQNFDNQDEISIITKYQSDLMIKEACHHYNFLPLLIVIRDTGAGVSEKIKDHLFNPFISDKENGLGIGLALCKKIVQNHGGMIDVERNKKFTDFKIYLPIKQSKANLRY